MKEITSSTSDFEDIIKGDYLYVDKTEFIWNLVKSYKGIFFMSRPRPFGKSLTVSTLEAVFQGKRDLFKGLTIYDKPYSWEKYPVTHLDMTTPDYSSPEIARHTISRMVLSIALQHGVQMDMDTPGQMLLDFIARFRPQGKVVILVDEYDRPILDTIGTP